MKHIIHISTECYPLAKAGGMADVVGALPSYQLEHGWKASVVIPHYDLPLITKAKKKMVSKASLKTGQGSIPFKVNLLKSEDVDFDVYTIEVPQLYFRDSIYLAEDGYGFHDEALRNTFFQRAVLKWLDKGKHPFDLIHCHDHQAGFIPFLTKSTNSYKSLKKLPVFYSIHNGAYNTRLNWDDDFLPEISANSKFEIDWDGQADAVRAAIRFSDHVSTVSPTYLEELQSELPQMKQEFELYPSKFSGILNGIDVKIWDPKSDKLIDHHLKSSVDKFKKANKSELLEELYQLEGIPLISCIGRFAYQKGSDLLAAACERILGRFGFVNFFILGSGDKHIEYEIQSLRDRFPERVACYIGYNEAVAHKVYAASDFILMPSRFEPCGLNQMIGMRYGALPIARRTGGLKDTVVDYESGGMGISHEHSSVENLIDAMARALHLYQNRKGFNKLRKHAMKADNSWSLSAKKYGAIYDQLM